MTPDRWQHVKELLSAALERQGKDRSAYVAKVCAGDPELREELESLLAAASDAGSFFEQSPLPLLSPGEAGQHQPDPLIGTSLGPYRLIQEIGHGGMGTVFLAVRDDGHYQQEVAIKLVRSGRDTEFALERFLYERQLLAFLNHPGIARLLDGGTTPDGRPYFVMEFIEGQIITDYCLLNELSTVSRLELFREVCAAVAHAHRNLIVHRDIKPTNILVTSAGVPKLLDFGIAKLILPESAPRAAGQTQGIRLLTPDYASPEQVRGQAITTATDVYSLGAVLYEMLAGQRAHLLNTYSPLEVERVVCEDDPPRPSTIRRELAGDLENIVLKALQKDPALRYSSVEQFSEDIRRYLTGLPVIARRDTLSYRTAKFIRRHRTAVIAGALVSLSLIAGAITTGWQAHIASQQRERAERRFQEVRRLANAFLVNNDLIASLPGSTPIRGVLIQRALEYLDRLAKESSDDQELQGELATAYEKMGDVQGRADGPNLGDTAGALASYRKALAVRETLAKQDPQNLTAQKDLASIYSRLSGVLKVAGDYQSGLSYDRKALTVRESLLAAHQEDRDLLRQVAASYTTLGGSLFQIGDWNGTRDARRKALSLYQRLASLSVPTDDDLRGLALAYIRMGSMAVRDKDPKSAIQHYNDAIASAQLGLKHSPQHVQLRSSIATARAALGTAYLEQNRAEEALTHYRAANGIYAELSAADPLDARMSSLLAGSHLRIGQALVKAKRTAPALTELRRALELRLVLAEKNPLNAGARGEVAESYGSLGDAYSAAGEQKEALRWYTKAETLLTELDRSGKTNAASKQELARIQREVKTRSGS